MRVRALTRYSRRGASSRVRVYQFLDALEQLGVHCDVQPLLGDAYLGHLYDGEQLDRLGVLRAYAERLAELLRPGHHDVTWVQKELLPFVPHLVERQLLGDYVFDFDDAVHLRYKRSANPILRATLGRKFDQVLANARSVIAGNAYLADVARQAGASDVTIIPSVVPVEHYPLKELPPSEPLVIGWIGSTNTVHYLERLRFVFELVGKKRPLEVMVVGAQMEKGRQFRTRCVEWSEDSETRLVSEMHIGVMPLDDTEWERGKCAYKAIQYMAAARPVVASAVGANRDVIQDGVTGYLATSHDQWQDALERLAGHPSEARTMGKRGRARVEAHYSVDSQAPRLAAVLRACRHT